MCYNVNTRKRGEKGMTNEEIGHRIKTEREKQGLTLQEVADMIGVHKFDSRRLHQTKVAYLRYIT